MERLILPKEAADKLLTYGEALRKHHYGKIIPWEEAQRLVPRKSFFSVTDLESGLTFHVQRRAASDHADIQPLTKDDTKIMKQVSNNRWSWRRKAILVYSKNQWIAASMNGMPHGGNGIPGNGFSGVSPDVLAKSFVEAVHQQDPDLLREVFEGCPPKKN